MGVRQDHSGSRRAELDRNGHGRTQRARRVVVPSLRSLSPLRLILSKKRPELIQSGYRMTSDREGKGALAVVFSG